MNNSTNSSINGTALPSYSYYPLEVNIVLRTLQASTAFLGALGNLLVCVVILVASKRTSSIRLYLFSLAVADLGILLLIFPTLIMRMEQIPWPLGVFGCTYLISIAEMFYPASIWTMTLIAVSRYVHIARAMRQVAPMGPMERAVSFKKIHISLACVWLASFLVSSVPLFWMLKYDSERQICLTEWPKDNTFAYVQAYLLTTALLFYFIPLVIITVTYCCIRERLNTSIRFHQSMATVGNYNQMTWHSIKAKKILTPLVLAFALLMMPITIVRLLMVYHSDLRKFRYFQVMYDIFLYCLLLNSAIDPLIYYMVNSEFKKGIREIMGRCRGRSVQQDDPRSQNLNMTMTTRQ